MTTPTALLDTLGGPDAPVGSHGRTAQELVNALDEVLGHLTHPGSRVYPPAFNQALFWSRLIEKLS